MSPSNESFPAASSPPTERAPIFEKGVLLQGVYEIRGVLGEGAMGQVFEAHDTLLERRVAIKAHWPDTLLSIRHEARALAPIRHPSIVTVHALGKHDGVEFTVMEYVAGSPWSQHLERMREAGEPAPVLETLDILERIADGLEAVHGAGLAHGDVKPANVLLAPNRVMLTDLGLVRVEGRPLGLRAVAGTPTYLAPEVVSGDIAVGSAHLVDVYAFGVMAYEALAGRPPYEAEHAVILFSMHLEDPIPKLADTVDVPERLSQLLASAMAKEPHDRPTMTALLWQLRGIIESMTAGDQPLDVLVVDDDADIARLLAVGVKEGCPAAIVEIVGSGAAALERVRRREPALMVIDLMMPGMTGFELFTYLRGAGLVDNCNVVAVSAAAPNDDVSLLLDLGVAAFIQKGANTRKEIREIARAYAAERSASAQVSRAPASSSRRPSVKRNTGG
ncbi:MAG: protein kinase [Labilithrix sp.]|nr:protein kinase [Labilithrix sp.]MBX3222725.1 protein kinase [Labilithrix sp.]